MSGRRPEHIAPPEIFYDVKEAYKYTKNTRIIDIQESMTNRAIELLELPPNQQCLLLDLGCGSGLSSQCIEEHNHKWIGADISEAMIDIAKQRKEDGDLEDMQIIQSDLGEGLPFKPGSFDGAISVSALQWLCNADKKSHSPAKRLLKLFTSLYTCLSRQARAVFQFYPENPQQVELINQQALRAGFTGGLVIDNPNSTKAKKFFLVLSCGGASFKLPNAIIEETSSKHNTKHEVGRHKEFVMKKKERARKQGKIVKRDSKYTARKRPGKF